MIIKNEIPLLEYDDSSSEVISPDHDWTAEGLPEKCLFAFLGDVSFECFLLHVIIIRLIDMVIRYLPGISTEGLSGNNIIDTFVMLISLAAVIFISWLVKEIGDKNGTFRRRRTGRD